MDTKRRILGIDPGTQMIGWGVVDVEGGKPRFCQMGVISLKGEKDHFAKLGRIFNEIGGLVHRFAPNEFAIESPFYGKNVQSMLKLGRAQGIAIAAALNAGLPVYEYAPRKIKQSITGKGAASKEQVSSVICAILSVKELPEALDATDGLAAALCHFLSGDVHISIRKHEKGARQTNKERGWEAFLKNNPGRIK